MRTLVSILFILFAVSFSYSKDKNQHFEWSATASVSKAKAGEQFTIQIDFDFEKGWYIYDIIDQIGPEGLGPQKTEISFSPKNFLKIAGKIKTPKPKVKYDSAFYIDIRTFSGKFSFVVSVIAQKDIDFSQDKIFVELYAQQCKDNLCLPGMDFKQVISPGKGQSATNVQPSTETDTALSQAQTSSKSETAITQTKETLTDTSKEIQTARQKGLLAYLLFAMGAGALALLTPCVFPMVPITVSFFTKRAEKNPGKGLRDSLIYGLGIILTFTALGFLLALISVPREYKILPQILGSILQLPFCS
jgi:thiol:disulfide interchange protein